MAVAQAIGGTRQYNSLLVLMDNWQEALDGVHHSMNAQGSAARRNAEIMQTYSKQVEQTKASFVELQTAFGKIAFPVAKFGLQSMKTLAETISAIPTSFKVASVAALGLFTYLSQGAKVLDSISDFFSGGTPIMGGLITSIKDELKTTNDFEKEPEEVKGSLTKLPPSFNDVTVSDLLVILKHIIGADSVARFKDVVDMIGKNYSGKLTVDIIRKILFDVRAKKYNVHEK
jgi:hypothetical protein